MKNTILFLFLASCILISCKKDKTPDETGNNEPGLFGFIPTDSATLSAIPILDTAIFFNGRLMALPDTFALDMPPIKSQGGEGSCVAFSCGYAARSFLFHKNQGISYFKSGTNTIEDKVIFSPEYLYNSAKQAGDCLTAGMNIPSALNFMKTNGISNWNTMPYSSNNGCSTLPNATQISNGSNFKIQDFYRISNISTAYLKDILHHNNPIIIGVKLDDGFWRDGKFIWNSRRGVDVGKHAIVICGWDDNKQAFKIMNSWGTWWGFNGYGWIGYNYLANVLNGNTNNYEMYVMKTQPNAALQPNLTIDSAQNITSTSAILGGTITSLGVLNEPITDRGISYSTSLFFASKTKSTETTNTFKVTLNSLLANQQYYYWTYAANVYGTTIKGKSCFLCFHGIPFKTLANVSVPSITTTAATNIISTSANTGGNIVSNGGSTISASGVCYSTSPNPTTSNSVSNAGVTSGSFISILSQLQINTTYYVRAFATNTLGTGYGNEVGFTTTGSTVTLPTVVTVSTTDITNSSIRVIGNLTNTGNANGPKGFLISTLPNPTLANTTPNVYGTGIGVYNINISGLAMGTLYYVRAYATNSAGTAYGTQLSFTTTSDIFNPSLTYGTMTDIDGNVYKTIQIGTQIWMAENLKTTKYKNGNAITTGLSDAAWQATTSGACAIYNNNTANNTTYGKLYNWHAVNTGNLAPTGWHVPTDAEWTTLTNYLGGENVSGGLLKSTSSLWTTPNTGADNSSGFSGIPGGYRASEGTYQSIGTNILFWSSTQNQTNAAWYRYLHYNYNYVYKGSFNRTNGFSVRCVKD